MKINLLTIAGALTLLMFFGCKIGEDSPVRDFYFFEQGVSLDPVKKEYILGDIFWMGVNVSGKQFTDEITGKAVTVGNATFTIRLEVFDPFVAPDDTEKFSLAEQSGVVTEAGDFDENGSAVISYGCPVNYYDMKVGVQFKKAGGYLVHLVQKNPSTQIVFTEENDCSIIQPNTIPPDEAEIATVHFTFDVEDTNRDKFDEYAAGFPDTNVDLATFRNALDKKEAFFVRVE